MDQLDQREKVITINEWIAREIMLPIVEKLDVAEADGRTYLDNSRVLSGNELGMNHLNYSVPTLLAGSLGGHFETGRYVGPPPRDGGTRARALDGMVIGGERVRSPTSMVVPPTNRLAAITLALTCSCWVRAAAAETVLSGGMLGPQTWTPAGSPYIVRDTLTVESLRVDAGTVVRVESPPDAGAGIAIFVSGDFVIDARPDEPALFEPVVESTYWFGIQANTATVTGAVVRWGQNGIVTRSTTALMRVHASVFERAMLQPRGPLEVDRTLFLDCAAGILGSTGALVVTNSIFRSASTQGGFGVDVSGETTIVNSTFDGLAAAFYVGAVAVVRNSIVTNSRYVVSRGQVDVSNSLFWNITDEVMSGALTEGEGVLRADPQYASATDLHLLAGSPAVDSGTRGGAPDHDFSGETRPQGAGIDLGAYEFRPNAGGMGGSGGMRAEGGIGGAAGRTSGGAGIGGASAGASATGGTEAGAGGEDDSGAPSGGTAANGGSAAGRSGSSGAGARGGASDEARQPKTIETNGCGCRIRTSSREGTSVVVGLAALLLTRRRRRSRHNS